jgi:sensor histidine kinase YesM
VNKIYTGKRYFLKYPFNISMADRISDKNSFKSSLTGIQENLFYPGMNRKKLYWISQVSGWGIFTIINILVIASFETMSWQRGIIWIYLYLVGIAFTHVFRGIIKKRNWLTLPLKKIIPRVLVSSIIIGASMYIIVFSVNVLSDTYDMEKFRAITPFIGIFNLSSIILLWALIYFSVHYFENYKKAEIESYIWEAAVKDFELKTLKSQLNPHFMFNAMNGIRALIEEDPKSAQAALTKLSNILRYSLKIERNETVPLHEEMETVEDYLALESIRFEERLKYDIRTDPKAAKVEIPPMMIQTLVENGIKHGISKITTGGMITINTFIENNGIEGSNLHIRIKNSGNIDNESLKNAKGFGIDNTKHRLNLLYGENASFTIKNEPGNEVTAELIIPTGGTKK